MKPKSSLMILEKREVTILSLVGMMIFLFSFTLGVHYGKKVGSPTDQHGEHSVSHEGEGAHGVEHSAPVADKVPSKIEFSEQSRGVKEAGDLSLAEALESEVARTGIRLDSPRQVELPTETKSKNAGATSPPKKHSLVQESAPAPIRKNLPQAEVGVAPAAEPEGSRYFLQIGSYPVMKEARERIAILRNEGLSASMKSVELGERGTWYRVYVGDFKSRNSADEEGKRLKEKKLIENYVVSATSGASH